MDKNLEGDYFPRADEKGTRKNPIIKNGKEYVYGVDGGFVIIEHMNRERVARNTLSVETALTK